MQWFKHYSSASISVKLSSLIDELGVAGYGRYWLLLELLANTWDGESTFIDLHFNTIHKQLQYYKKTMTKQFLNNRAIVSVLFNDCSPIVSDSAPIVYSFNTSILLDLQSRDFKISKRKRVSTAPKSKNKIKNKNIYIEDNLNSDLIKNNSVTENEVAQCFNEILAGTGKFKHANFFVSPIAKEDFKTSVGYLPKLEDWKSYFLKIKALPKLNGTEELGFSLNPTFSWVLKPKTIADINEGLYESEKSNIQREKEKLKKIVDKQLSEGLGL